MKFYLILIGVTLVHSLQLGARLRELKHLLWGDPALKISKTHCPIHCISSACHAGLDCEPHVLAEMRRESQRA